MFIAETKADCKRLLLRLRYVEIGKAQRMIRTVVVLYWTVLIIGLAIIATQIILPAIQGRPFFPLLRPRVRNTETAIAVAREEQDLAEQQAELERITAGTMRRPEPQPATPTKTPGRKKK